MKQDKLKLINELEDYRKQMIEMKNIIKQKDEALKSFEERKVTIEILIYKIRVLGDQMKKDKEKMDRVHREDVEKYERELHNLMNQVTNLKFELSKKGAGLISRGKDSAQLRAISKDKADDTNNESAKLKAEDNSSRYLIKKNQPMTSTRSQLLSLGPSSRLIRPTTAMVTAKKGSIQVSHSQDKMGNLFSKRSMSKPAIKTPYLAI